MAQDMSTHEGHGEEEEHGLGHVVSPGIMYSTGLALLVLTVLTVAVRYVDAGEMNMPIALGIAGLKATLVAMFFMHLRWDRPFNAIIFITSISLVVLLMIFALMDSGQYDPKVYDGNPRDVQMYLDVQAPQAPITADKSID